MQRVMSTELGSEWSKLFATFDRTPIASASIGQVHRATLQSGEEMAVKIQFPGIRDSITSDLSYLAPLLASSSILPRGLYLQNTIAVMKRELADECDYLKEAEAGRRFGAYLDGDDYFDVPKVIDEACTERVLTTSWMPGKPLSRMKGMSQASRDNVSRPSVSELKVDWHQYPSTLSTRAVPLPIHANRPELGQLPVQPSDRSYRLDRLWG